MVLQSFILVHIAKTQSNRLFAGDSSQSNWILCRKLFFLVRLHSEFSVKFFMCFLIHFVYLYIFFWECTGSVALTSGFPNGNGQIWLDRVGCRGAESRLADCPASNFGALSTTCTHARDAGVRCGMPGTILNICI